MKRKLFYLLSIPGSLIAGWFFASLLWGWSPNPVLPILRAAALAAAVWLSGAALFWAGRRSAAGVWLVCGLLVLAALVLIPPIFHEHEPDALQVLNSLPLLGFLLPQLLPCLALVVAALLLYSGLKQLSSGSGLQAASGKDLSAGPQNPGRIAAATLALSALVLAGGLYHLYWLFVWDSTYDSIDIIFLISVTLPALFSTALLAMLLPGRQKSAAWLYGILTPVTIIAIFWSAKQVDYRLLTETRAERISQALQKYYARRGNYPDALSQLAPWTMLSIPGPMIMYGQDWCYQGAKDGYRLGYIDREHWSSPELFAREFTATDPTQHDGDLCAAEIKLMKERYPDYYGFKYRGQ